MDLTGECRKKKIITAARLLGRAVFSKDGMYEMKYSLSTENEKWLQSVYPKLCAKMERECLRVGDMIPDLPEEGRYRTDMGKKDITCWINGFWGGMMWQMYHATGKKIFLNSARSVEQKLDQAFDVYDGLHHDVGFMWLPTAVADYKMTGDRKARTRGLHAANLLAGRYNPRAGFIRAWNPHMRGGKEEDCIGWMIVDSLMNLPVLYWAAEEARNPAYTYIAENHADKALQYIMREDGSCNHIVVIDYENGEFLHVQEGQGYALDSAWSRGQAWAIYGFAVSAKYTKNLTYLAAAKRVSNYFIACTDKTGHISACDFRAPQKPFLSDTSAGVCAACGILEIADQLNGTERDFYIDSAVNIVRETEKRYGNWNMEEDGLLNGGRGSYHSGEPEEGRPMIFGDYYFVEAILRLMERYLPVW